MAAVVRSRHRTATAYFRSPWPRLVYLLIISGLLASCNLPLASTPDAPALSTMVAKTMHALTPGSGGAPRFTPIGTAAAATRSPTLTPTSTTAEIRGQVCYRNAAMADLTLYFENTQSNQVTELLVSRPQETYTVQLPPGTYRIYGWPPDFAIGVLYTGGTLTVSSGQEYFGVDICDWVHGPFDVPYPPGYNPELTTGSISGSIYGYPYGPLPSLTIVAFSQTTPYYYYFITVAGQADYSMVDYIPTGRYLVVAYDASGNAGGCPTEVNVIGGQTASCDITDWSGGYPSKPSGVP